MTVATLTDCTGQDTCMATQSGDMGVIVASSPVLCQALTDLSNMMDY